MAPDRNAIARARAALLCAALLVLQGCSYIAARVGSPAPRNVDVNSVPDAMPRNEPRSRYGNPDTYIVNGTRYFVLKDSRTFVEDGIASWYGKDFHGRRTSNGETYDMYGMTAAHKTLPLPTYVEVTNLANGRKVIVRVNDRGPFHENRIIDLTYTAAAKLDILGAGTGLVQVRAIDPAHYRPEGAPVAVSAPAGDSPGFYIQIGAFSKRINAESLRDRLGPFGSFLVGISEALIDGKTWYRVRIGPIHEVDAADHIVDSLKTFGILNPQIVVD